VAVAVRAESVGADQYRRLIVAEHCGRILPCAASRYAASQDQGEEDQQDDRRERDETAAAANLPELLAEVEPAAPAEDVRPSARVLPDTGAANTDRSPDSAFAQVESDRAEPERLANEETQRFTPTARSRP
jgi:hypothetical protein